MSMEEIDDAQRLKIIQEENEKFLGQLLHSSRLAFMTELVKINDWTDFMVMWSTLDGKFDLLLYQPLLHCLIEKI